MQLLAHFYWIICIYQKKILPLQSQRFLTMKKIKPYLDQEGRALPYPWIINTMLMLVGGSQTLRLNRWSKRPRHAAEKTLRDILTISRDTRSQGDSSVPNVWTRQRPLSIGSSVFFTMPL